MLPKLLLVILLGFPLLELWVAVLVAQKIGWWLLLWLIADVVLGLYLIREMQFSVLGRLAQAMQAGEDPFVEMRASGRVLLAGLLLIFPGVVTDAFALLVLLWPRSRTRAQPRQRAQDIEIIEGEFTREAERDRDRLP